MDGLKITRKKFSAAFMENGEVRQKTVVVIVLCLIMGAGFFLRIGSLPNWLEHKERYFFHEQQIPLMLTVDSYYYLEIARQLQEGTFADFDERRHVPVGYRQPATPPLLSVLLAQLSKKSGASLEWVALLLPSFLGALLAIPVYLLTFTLAMQARGTGVDHRFRCFSARIAGLAAALPALLSPLFWARSAVGWCDTDALNVAFPVLLAYLAIRVADAERLKGQIVTLVGFGVVTLLFLWWWDQSHVPVFAFAGIPFVVALFFVGLRSPKRLLSLVLFAMLLIFLVGWWKGFALFNPLGYLEHLQGVSKYIASEAGSSPFRPAGAAVSEQLHSTLGTLMRQSSGGWPGFLLACCGLLLLVWVCRGYACYLIPLVIVALLSMKGQRFLIFTAPLFGLGVGMLCLVICCRVTKPVRRTAVLALLLVVSCWGALQTGASSAQRAPRRMPVLFDAMQVIKEKTEKDAVVWASWGHGHPLLYYGQRGVIADGIFHNAELQYVLTFPLATSDFRTAANWISFYAVNGPQGLRRANELLGGGRDEWATGINALQTLLGAGVQESRRLLRGKYRFSAEETEQYLRWLFPGTPRPVYLFLDYLLLKQAWFTLGRWDPASRSGPKSPIFFPLQQVSATADGKIDGMSEAGKVTIDVKSGRLDSGGKTTSLGVLKVHDGKKVNTKTYEGNSGLWLEVFLPGRIGVLAEQETANTVLTRLYYEYTYNRHFFAPTVVGNPFYSIWKISGERYDVASRK